MQSRVMPGNGTPPRFRVGDLEVDVGKAEVTRGDETIALPKLSFDLLCALINAAPAIVTNDELLQQVWPGLLVSPESVAQRVKLLRSAIGDDSQRPRYILGVRGRGYRLVPVPERLTEARQPTSDAGFAPTNTPSGAEVVADGSATTQSAPIRRAAALGRRVGIAAAVLAAVGVVVALGLRYWPAGQNSPRRVAVAIVDKSIAVLPFVDMSENKDQEYLADGMTEEIIGLLAKIPGLKVIARTSSFQFKGKSADLRAVGRQLGVAYLLEGSVRKSADQLRVSAQLIDSRDGKQLLSRSYDRNLSDVLRMQGEIATQVVLALETEVNASDLVSQPALRNAESYTAYLKGLHDFNRIDQQGFEQAVSDFQQALDLDPSFEQASGWLAIAYFTLGAYGFMPPALAFEQARQSAEHSLKLDPNGRAHTLLADIYLTYDWDWPAAEREMALGRANSPNDMGTLIVGGAQAMTLGRWDDAVKLVNAQLQRDPLFPFAYLSLSMLQLRRGRAAEAEAAARRAFEISPTFAFAHTNLGAVLLARGEPDAALEEFVKDPIEGARLKGASMAYFALGRRAESDISLKGWLNLPETHRFPFSVAELYAFRQQFDEAFKWLDRAYEQKDPNLHNIKLSVLLDSLHDDPRYKALLRKMHLPE
jgi:TolB-like protein/DNA-binding winged helix-turn-helix (wHTH) protein